MYVFHLCFSVCESLRERKSDLFIVFFFSLWTLPRGVEFMCWTSYAPLQRNLITGDFFFFLYWGHDWFMSFLQPFPLGYVAQPQPGIGIIQLSILAVWSCKTRVLELNWHFGTNYNENILFPSNMYLYMNRLWGQWLDPALYIGVEQTDSL